MTSLSPTVQRCFSADRPFTQFWLILWSSGLSLGWLLPNHYAPWVAFHFDAWIACFLTLAGFVVAIRSSGPVHLHRVTVFFSLVVCVPFIQYGFGSIPFQGMAWIGAAFVLGLVATMLLGARWEDANPAQAIDGLFLAIGIAATVSVGMQLYQWLGLFVDVLNLWVMGVPHARPFANFLQPNQLATFLLWGLLGCAWGVARSRISWRVAIFIAMYLLIGVALTQSRTAFVAIVAMVVVAFLWRNVWPSRAVPWAVAGLAAFYLVCVAVLPMLGRALSIDTGPSMVTRVGTELRIPAYQMFFEAIQQKPLWGYGWSQTAEAQLAVAGNHQKMGGILMHAHNLFLDLIIWCGIPLGVLISIMLIAWFLDKARKVESAQNAILVMFVGVVAWHAMLELPLHYAYLLLPTGLVMGVLNSRLREPIVLSGQKWHFTGSVLVAAVLLAVIARDYLRIEENFYVLRFERARIGEKPSGPPASVVLLDQMNEYIRMGRTPARIGMSTEELNWMRKATHAYPSLGNFFTLSLALAWNQRADEAQILVNKLPKITTTDEYIGMRTIWRQFAITDSKLAAVVWPD